MNEDNYRQLEEICNNSPLYDDFYAALARNNSLLNEVLRISDQDTTSLSMASRKGNSRLTKFLISLFSKESILSEMLLAGPPCELAYALHIAAARGHTDVVTQLIQAAQSLEDDKNTVLKMMLLLGPSGEPAYALYIASANGHVDVVTQLIEAAQSLGDQNQTLKTMLLFGPSGEPAYALYIASANGHVDVVTQLIEAAQRLEGWSQTLEAILIGGPVGRPIDKQQKDIFGDALLNGVVSRKITINEVSNNNEISIIKKTILDYLRRHYSHDIHFQLMNKGTPLRSFMEHRQGFMPSRTEQALLQLFQQKRKEAEESATIAYDSGRFQAATLFNVEESTKDEVEHLLYGELGL